MKRTNYIIMIALLIFVELFSILFFLIDDKLSYYFNNPIIPILIFALVVLVVYFIYCKKSISSNICNKKIEKIIITIISVITILKVFDLIPIVTLKKQIIEPMKEINNNYMSYSSFTELREVANITATNVDEFSTPYNFLYFNLGVANYFKNFFLGVPIMNSENNYNNSYSSFVKDINKKSNAIFGESWIYTATSIIERLQRNSLLLAVFSIIYEILVVAIPIIIKKIS